MSKVKKTTNWSGFAPLKNGPATVSPLKVLSATQSSDFLITGFWPAVSLPSPSTETMSGAYIVRMTSKFLPCRHNSTNLLATALTLIVDSNRPIYLIFAQQAGSPADGTLAGHVRFAESVAAVGDGEFAIG